MHSHTANALAERDPSKPAQEQGLFHKFNVRRTDGRDKPGEKHHGCCHFVLDMDHDKHARAALATYADAVEATHPFLAVDLRAQFSLNPPAAPIAEVQVTPAGWVRLVVRGVVVAGRSPRSTYPDLHDMAKRINAGTAVAPSTARKDAKGAIAPWAEDTARVWAEQAISAAASFGLALSVVDGVATFQPAAEVAS